MEKPKLSVANFYATRFSKYSGTERVPLDQRRPPSPVTPSSSTLNTGLNGHQAPWSVPVFYGDTRNQPPPPHNPPPPTHHHTHPALYHSPPSPHHHHPPIPHSPPSTVQYSGPVYSHRRPSLYELLFKIYPTQLYLGWKRMMSLLRN